MSQTTEAQTTPPTSEEVIGKVNESIAALQEAQKTVVEGAQLLAAHVNDPTAHGAAIPEVVEQQLPTPVMEGTSLKWEKKDGTIVAGPVDLKGAPGQDGADGDTGPRPEHRWEGTKLLVQNSDGSWPAEGVDLKGDKGDTGQVEGLSDAVDSNSSTTPASSKAVKTAYDKAVTAQNAANTADSKAQAAQSAADTAQAAAEAADAKAQAAQSAADAAQSAADAAQAGVDGIPLASASVAGLVKIGTNLSVSSGTVSVASASTSAKGVVQLSSATNSTSTTTAATSSAVKAAYDKANAAAAFPAGTQMLFVQAAAPTGWTKQTTVNDATVRIVSGATGGTTGGSVAFSTAFVAGKTITLSGNVGATTLSSTMIPNHVHNTLSRLGYTGSKNGRAPAASEILSDTQKVYSETMYNGCGWSGGCGNDSHTHSLSGAATVDLSVKYVDVILCKKA